MSAGQKQFYERIFKFIRQYQMIEAGERVLVGVSGGVDSVVLLHVLYQLRERLGIDLHVVHLNHQFRGKEAARDADFVRRCAFRLQLACTIESFDTPALIRQKKLSPQDAARQVRYKFFETLASRINAQKIATAHHADDQAETVLLGMIRGVGIHGLGGIQPVLHQTIIRPFLTTTREQIEAYAQAEGLDYVFDSSNTSRKYLRNAIRLDLLPFLKQKFTPAIVKRLTAYAQLFQEDAFFIDKITRERYIQICRNVDDVINIDLELFTQENVTIQREIVYKAFEELTGSRHRLETDHARAVIELFTRKKVGKWLSLPEKVIAVRRSYPLGCLQRDREETLQRSIPPVFLTIPGKTTCDDFCVETEIFDTTRPKLYRHRGTKTTHVVSQYTDYACLCLPITVRSRLPGDRFRPLGMQGKKSLKKFFIDRKVPRDKRNSIPLIVDNKGIIWVVGYSIDDRVKITENTKKIFACRVYAQMKNEK